MNKINLKEFDPGNCSESVTNTEAVKALQIAVYTMCGGGLIGRIAAEQPADFYIDMRVGRLPFKRKEIEQAVGVLVSLARHNGLEPHAMPAMPSFHRCGIF